MLRYWASRYLSSGSSVYLNGNLPASRSLPTNHKLRRAPPRSGTEVRPQPLPAMHSRTKQISAVVAYLPEPKEISLAWNFSDHYFHILSGRLEHRAVRKKKVTCKVPAICYGFRVDDSRERRGSFCALIPSKS